MFKIGICGHFGDNKNLMNGQTVKTKILTDELAYKVGRDNTYTVDTHKWRERPFSLMYECYILIKNCENVIIMPAQNGLKIFVPLFALLNSIFKKELHYMVIGGWLPKLVKDNRWLLISLNKFNNIFVETNVMKMELNILGLSNVQVIPNFKRLSILKEDECFYDHSKPYKLCTFSRVMKEKGIEDAIQTIIKINEECNEIVYTLDIYGPIEDSYSKKFDEIINKVPNYIHYKGVVPYNKSVDILKYYFMLLFPTRFKTEGIPGTIIDAYASGLPVLSSEWNSAREIIDNQTGFIYNFQDLESMKEILENISHNPEEVISRKNNCLEAVQKYVPENVVNNLLNLF